MNPRRHPCRVCNTLVDVTGLRVVSLSASIGNVYECRVTTACRVRAARAKRATRQDTVPWSTETHNVVRICRFCGYSLPPEYSLLSKVDEDVVVYRYECKHVGACERRMVKGT